MNTSRLTNIRPKTSFFWLVLFTWVYNTQQKAICQSTSKAFRANDSFEIEKKETKPHYVLRLNNQDQEEYLTKCIAKYPNWNNLRMLSKRRTIQIEAPYTAEIELYSELELNRLYGKTITPELSDNDSDYLDIRLQVTQSGFKEIILSRSQK